MALAVNPKRARVISICGPAILVAASCHAIVGIESSEDDSDRPSKTTSTSTGDAATTATTTTDTSGATSTSDTSGATSTTDTASSTGTGALTYEQEVLADDPILWFRFDQASGDAIDKVSGSALGNVIGDGTYTAGRIGNALRLNAQLDGNTDAVEVAPQNDQYAFADGADFTIEAWFRAPGLVGRQFLFSRQITPGDSRSYGYSLEVQNVAGSPYVIGYWGSEYVEEQLTNPAAYHYVALVHDGGFLWLAVDGTHTVEALNGEMLADLEERLFLGASPLGSFAFVGEIDDFAIYDVALSQARLDAHFNAPP